MTFFLWVEQKRMILELICKIENNRAIGTFARWFHRVVEGRDMQASVRRVKL